MALYLRKRHEGDRQSEIHYMSLKCDEIDRTNLSQGICDIEVPMVMQRGAINQCMNT